MTRHFVFRCVQQYISWDAIKLGSGDELSQYRKSGEGAEIFVFYPVCSPASVEDLASFKLIERSSYVDKFYLCVDEKWNRRGEIVKFSDEIFFTWKMYKLLFLVWH